MLLGEFIVTSITIGSIPSEVGYMAALQWMDLGNNRISGSNIAYLESKVDLFVIIEYVLGTLPPQIGKLQSLLSLNVNKNKLTGECIC